MNLPFSVVVQSSFVLEKVWNAIDERENKSPDPVGHDPARIDRISSRIVHQRIASDEVQGIADRNKSVPKVKFDT